MAKKFNITGTCIPGRHYMADTSGKLKKVMDMVEAGEYFIINRPRQYGKTTTLFLLDNMLQASGEYLPVRTSFEGIGDAVFENEKRFSAAFLQLLAKALAHSADGDLEQFVLELAAGAEDLNALSAAISKLAQHTGKKIVLLIDEVDKSSNNQLFVSFLGVLRNKYLARQEGKDDTFHAVVLAGVHDVRTLKLKIRPGEEAKFNSPWNIAADFKVDMNLQSREIVPMLEDYAQERGARMDTRLIAERLFYYTSGYPFLVSKLCKMLDEEIMPQRGDLEWAEQDIDAAVSQLAQESNTNFDSLIKNLENYPELYKVTHDILIEGEFMEYNIHDPVVNLGILYGVFRNGSGIKIHNRVYEELIYNYMTSKAKSSVTMGSYNFRGNFILPDNRLDIEKVLLKFQAFMREQYSKKDRDFLERHGRLIFLAFIKPIINGAGYDFKETQISEEKRLDVVITFYQHKYVAELKVWRGEEAHQNGLLQLADYLDRLHLTEGWLIIFDHSEQKSWKQERLEAAGKQVFAVWV